MKENPTKEEDKAKKPDDEGEEEEGETSMKELH